MKKRFGIVLFVSIILMIFIRCSVREGKIDLPVNQCANGPI